MCVPQVERNSKEDLQGRVAKGQAQIPHNRKDKGLVNFKKNKGHPVFKDVRHEDSIFKSEVGKDRERRHHGALARRSEFVLREGWWECSLVPPFYKENRHKHVRQASLKGSRDWDRNSASFTW